MTDAELCALIDSESRQAIGGDDDFAADRARSLEFYMGEAKGDLAPPSVAGRSKVVSKDVLDIVEWMMPSLMRMFAGSDEIIRFEPEDEGDEQACNDATEYVGYLIHRKNDGFTVLHDAIKSALIQRIGIVKVYCDKRWETREETYRNVSQIELDALQADPDVEIVEATAQPAEYAEGVPPELAVAYDVVCRRKQRVEKFACEGVPPEEIRISKDSRDIANVRFIEHRVERTVSDLLSMGYDRKLVESLPSDDNEADLGPDQQARHDYDDSDDFAESTPDPSQRKVTLCEAYVRVDYDGDGIAEYRRVVKAGHVVFENDVTDEHPFALFTPLLMPYKLIGLSFADLIEDLQRIKTALMRQVLDNVYLSNNPRTEVVDGQVNLDDFLNPKPGGLVRVKQVGMMREVATPFVAGAGLQIIQQVDETRNARTGVTEFNQGLQSDALSKSNIGSEGVQELMNAGAQRIELVARVFAETGIKRMYLLMLKLVSQYQNRAERVRVNGRWKPMDPREWKNRYDMTVSVGIGTANKQQQIANLTLLGNVQKEAMQVGLATPQNIYHTVTKLAEAMGYKDSDQFFSPPNPNPPPPQPPESVMLEQMKQQGAMQLAQLQGRIDAQLTEVKSRYEAQTEQMKQQAQDAQAQRELQMQAERNAMQMANDREMARYKADVAAELERYKADLKRQTELDLAALNAATRPELQPHE